MTPYKHFRAQALEPHHEVDRKNFAKFVLRQNENFPQHIIFGRSIKYYIFRIGIYITNTNLLSR